MDRYPREAFASGLRILGEGQLSLTKFLVLTDGDIDVADFKKLWVHILERVNWQRDLFIFANVSQDTLDYTGPSVNKGSKAMLMGLGKEPRRKLPESFEGTLPDGCERPQVFLPGTLVVQGRPYDSDTEQAATLANWQGLGDWPVAILVDNTEAATVSLQEFLWSVFTRFEPAGDIHAAQATTSRFHVGLKEPIVIDCRMKPWYPPVLEVDPETRKKVDNKIVGMLPAMGLFVITYMRIEGRTRWLIIAMIAVPYWLMTYGLFQEMLHLPWPQSILGDWFPALRAGLNRIL